MASDVVRKGWFQVPGQIGDRSIEEQTLGLQPALDVCKGKTVLDIGCAEGAIAAQFARAGAVSVIGLERETQFCEVAREVCSGLRVEVIQAFLDPWIEEHPEPCQFDIVLALSVAHKLRDPSKLLRFACKSAKDMVVFRGPGKSEMYSDGWMRAKFGNGTCHVPTVMQEMGFLCAQTLESTRGERVEYWRRV